MWAPLRFGLKYLKGNVSALSFRMFREHCKTWAQTFYDQKQVFKVSKVKVSILGLPCPNMDTLVVYLSKGILCSDIWDLLSGGNQMMI